MTWPAFLLIHILAYSAIPLLQKRLVADEGTHPVMAAGFFRMIVAINLLVVFVLSRQSFQGSFNFNGLELHFILMTALYATGAIFSIKSLKLIPASEFAIISSSTSMWTAIGGLVFLGEVFSIVKLVGIGLILGAILLVSLPAEVVRLRSRKLFERLTRGHLYALIASMCWGFAFVNDVKLSANSDVLVFAAISFLAPTLVTFFVFPSALKSLPRQFNANSLKINIPLSLAYALAYVAILSAYRAGGEVSVITPLALTGTLLSIFWSYVFLRERSNLGIKLIAGLFLIAGAFLLSQS